MPRWVLANMSAPRRGWLLSVAVVALLPWSASSGASIEMPGLEADALTKVSASIGFGTDPSGNPDLSFSMSLNASIFAAAAGYHVRFVADASLAKDENPRVWADPEQSRNGEQPPAESTREPPVGCRDARGCPDLLVDPMKLADADIITQAFSPDDCAVVEGATEAGTRRLLRFTFTTPNVGAGDLKIGRVADNAFLFEWAPCHQHHHFIDYAHYRLWTAPMWLEWQRLRAKYPNATATALVDANPTLLAGLVSGHKQGFCVIDVRNYAPLISTRQYNDCTDDQGISRLWGDEYHRTLPTQWIDVTGVAPGPYVLEAEVNADRLFAESDYSNNFAALAFVLPPPA